jgi:hypothetical protein
VSFVKHDVLKGLIEETAVLWSAKHVFEHRIVGNDDVGNTLSCGIATPPPAWCPILSARYCLPIRFWRLAREVEEA